ncbi:hypothetical protein BV898_13213 [Hypsibius exemplaris]|uniref:Uncharacterized protein n=1 Tax=Hypsibius exemplaris TaxID=2072580 RepID=A0A1W0WBI4_HYPEX|nr:hypothetical protein BV898_13213 [Hypsibius exemplaris]
MQFSPPILFTGHDDDCITASKERQRFLIYIRKSLTTGTGGDTACHASHVVEQSRAELGTNAEGGDDTAHQLPSPNHQQRGMGGPCRPPLPNNRRSTRLLMKFSRRSERRTRSGQLRCGVGSLGDDGDLNHCGGQGFKSTHVSRTTHHSTSSSSALPERNVMQRMRKGLVSLRSGIDGATAEGHPAEELL